MTYKDMDIFYCLFDYFYTLIIFNILIYYLQIKSSSRIYIIVIYYLSNFSSKINIYNFLYLLDFLSRNKLN